MNHLINGICGNPSHWAIWLYFKAISLTIPDAYLIPEISLPVFDSGSAHSERKRWIFLMLLFL